MSQKTGDLFLGGERPSCSPESRLLYPRKLLTTHGVIVGMTGSGKTGLGVVLLEEALRGGVPTIVIDPKGDMGNLALGFPKMEPKDYEPWVDASSVDRAKGSVSDLAESVAQTWRRGLDAWGLGAEAVAQLHRDADVQVWTPGSSAGQPLNVVGSLQAPDLSFDDNAEALRAEIESFVSSLLVLAGIDAEPISSREHILLCNLIEKSWRAGQSLELGDLILQVADPPIRRLGVFDVDSFFPARARNKLAMKLNGVIASPSFAVWMQGPPLDVERLLRAEDGRPRGSVIYLPHLEEAQRQFVVTLLLSKVVTWMRRQSGTSDLRALVYMDEVFGFAPPSANPPSKRPILTLLKQARAHGLGVVLATQNPVDLDYKAMSNAGTWMVGRLSTERDKMRVVEALRSTGDEANYDDLIGGLDKRQFLLYSAAQREPRVFRTRWALSYLRGPMTLTEVGALTPARASASPDEPVDAATKGAEPASAEEPLTPAATTTSLTDLATHSGPAVSSEGRASTTHIPPVSKPVRLALPRRPSTIPAHFVHPSAAWLGAVGANRYAKTWSPAVVARLRLVFPAIPSGERPVDEWEIVWTSFSSGLVPSHGVHVDWDDRDLRDEGPIGGIALPLPEALQRPQWWREERDRLEAWLAEQRVVEAVRNPELGLVARLSETRDDFAARCRAEAERRADAEVAAHLERSTAKLRQWRAQLDQTAYKIDVALAEVASDLAEVEEQERMSRLLNAAMRGHMTAQQIAEAHVRRQRATTRQAEVMERRSALQRARAQVEGQERGLADDIAAIHRAWQARVDARQTDTLTREAALDVAHLGLLWLPTEAKP